MGKRSHPDDAPVFSPFSARPKVVVVRPCVRKASMNCARTAGVFSPEKGNSLKSNVSPSRDLMAAYGGSGVVVTRWVGSTVNPGSSSGDKSISTPS